VERTPPRKTPRNISYQQGDVSSDYAAQERKDTARTPVIPAENPWPTLNTIGYASNMRYTLRQYPTISARTYILFQRRHIPSVDERPVETAMKRVSLMSNAYASEGKAYMYTVIAANMGSVKSILKGLTNKTLARDLMSRSLRSTSHVDICKISARPHIGMKSRRA
jgi:hypothetical protein